MDLLMESYSLSQLQAAFAVVQSLVDSGYLSAAEVLRTIDTEIARRKTTFRSSPEFRKCPSCGRGFLAPIINRDGLKIVGCKACRYSEVVG